VLASNASATRSTAAIQAHEPARLVPHFLHIALSAGSAQTLGERKMKSREYYREAVTDLIARLQSSLNTDRALHYIRVLREIKDSEAVKQAELDIASGKYHRGKRLVSADAHVSA
jgi:hypothetical protein